MVESVRRAQFPVMQTTPPQFSEQDLSIDEVIEGRLGIVEALFGWGIPRLRGFRAGFADFRADNVRPEKLHFHHPELHGFDDATLPEAAAEALGYAGGVSAARSMFEGDAASLLPCGRDEILHEVSMWSENGNGDFDIDEAEWVVDAADATERFHAIMTPQAWREWLVAEHEGSLSSGQAGYAHLVLEDILHPVIYVAYANGTLDCWDGWHRLAASIVKGASAVPSICGNPSPAPLPQP
jgi:hypothetical protein